MKYSVGNPYLPEWEYVPDGEPKLFGNRVYIYGSHDVAGGSSYCIEDYVCWSAPENDLTDWKYEGIIYRKTQDPTNPDGKQPLFAPDVVKGRDGKYYLYYGLGLTGRLAVAVCDTPAGEYEFYGEIQKEDGTCFEEAFPYDPAVLVDDDCIFLYYGFSFHFQIHKPGITKSKGGMVVELHEDMKTVKGKPQVVLPCEEDAGGTGFEDHGFFEAASIRKIKNEYYLVYCANRSNQLCYARSENPTEGFIYAGVLISNGDFEYEGNMHPNYYYGNIHGGLLQTGKQWYIFYHRHTHGTQFSRQGCIEKLQMKEDGSFSQVEVTSTGPCTEYPEAVGIHAMYRVCNLNGPQHTAMEANFENGLPDTEPRLLQEEKEMYLSNMQNMSMCGYKYLNFSGQEDALSITIRGDKGKIRVLLDTWDGEEVAELSVNAANYWNSYQCQISKTEGKRALFFQYLGDNNCKIDMKEFRIFSMETR